MIFTSFLDKSRGPYLRKVGGPDPLFPPWIRHWLEGFSNLKMMSSQALPSAYCQMDSPMLSGGEASQNDFYCKKVLALECPTFPARLPTPKEMTTILSEVGLSPDSHFMSMRTPLVRVISFYARAHYVNWVLIKTPFPEGKTKCFDFN